MKDAYLYFLENIWPDVALARGVPDSVPPRESDFLDWYSGLADHLAVETYEERNKTEALFPN